MRQQSDDALVAGRAGILVPAAKQRRRGRNHLPAEEQGKTQCRQQPERFPALQPSPCLSQFPKGRHQAVCGSPM
jgi:hypothetical protein